MSEGTKKVLIIAGVVGLVVFGIYVDVTFYDPSCSNELVRVFNSSCFGPK